MYHEPFTNLYHTHYREYDAFHERWLSEDPAGYADGLNLYRAYMGVNYIDPMGNEIFTISLIGLYGAFKFAMTVFAVSAAIEIARQEVYDEERDWASVVISGRTGVLLSVPGVGLMRAGLYGKMLLAGAGGYITGQGAVNTYESGKHNGWGDKRTLFSGGLTALGAFGTYYLGNNILLSMGSKSGFGSKGLLGSIGKVPRGKSSSELRALYLEQVDSALFRAKLRIHNFIKKSMTFGKSKWVTSSDIKKQLLTNTDFKIGQGSLHRMQNGSFLAGGKVSRSYLNKTVIHHEMLHIGQYIRNPKIIDTRPIGFIHEAIPSFVGSPEIYFGGTGLMAYTSWYLYKGINYVLAY